MHRLHAYTVDLPAHTWRRNSNAVALSCACMGGPPTGGDSIEARGSRLDTQVDANGRSWALAAELLIGALDVVPLYRDDAVQASVGWLLFEMALQHGNAPVILRGILRDGRAWCWVHEFAEEFGISVAYEPLVLGERRGG